MKKIILSLAALFIYGSYSYGCVRQKDFLEQFDLSEIHFKGLVEYQDITRILLGHPIGTVKPTNKNLHTYSDLGIYPVTTKNLISKKKSYIIEFNKEYITVATPYDFANPPDFSNAIDFNDFKKLSKNDMINPVLVSCKNFPLINRIEKADCPYLTCNNAVYVQRLYVE